MPGLLAVSMGLEMAASSARQAIRTYGPALLTAALVLAAGTALRLWYFGVPFPNTYYAKISGRPLGSLHAGLVYLHDFAINRPLGALLLLVAAAALAGCVAQLWRCHRQHRALPSALRPVAMVSTAIVGFALLQLVTGGDHFYGFRGLQPVHHLMDLPILLSLGFARRSTLHIGRRPVPDLALLLPVLVAGGIAGHVGFASHRIVQEIGIADSGRETGRFLNRIAADPARSPSIGVVAAGGIALTYRGRVYDLLGLNWTAMARAGARREVAHGQAASPSRCSGRPGST